MASRNSLWAELSVFVFLFLVLGIGWLELGPGKILLSEWLLSSNHAANWASNWYQDKVDGFAKLLSPLITIASGSYAIYKGLRFADGQLHLRLQEFLKREEKRLRSARSQLRARIERPGPVRAFEEPTFLVEPMQRAVGELGWARYFWSARLPFAEKNLETSILEIEKQLELWKGHDDYYKRQLSAAHLLKGAISAANASNSRKSGQNDRPHNITALTHFVEALKIDPMDIEALEYAALTRIQLKDFNAAKFDVDRIIDVTEGHPKSLESWPRLSGQFFRFDKWSVCRG
jgi:tetratricopeptide (TPR) repeat protein